MGTRAGMAALAALVWVGSASANPIFLGTQGTTLYRWVNGAPTVETFTLSVDLTSLAVAPDGTIWGAAATDSDGDGTRELYTLADPLGAAPSVVFEGDFLLDNTAALSFIGDTLYGFQKTPGAPANTTMLVTIDPLADTQSTVGATGLTTVGANGSAYDPVSDTLFTVVDGALGNGDLTEVDYGLVNGPDPTGTVIGDMGVDFGNGGAEFFDGALYALVQDLTNQTFVLGSVNTTTGLFTPTKQFDVFNIGPVGLAVIPEPATLTFLALAGVALLRRRA